MSTTSLRTLEVREYDWRFVDAFPGATAATKHKLETLDELRQQLHLDDSVVSIDQHAAYCVLLCQLAQTLYVDKNARSAIPDLWFQNGVKACNCIWYEVVCQVLDLARRAFLKTFEHDKLPNIVTMSKRRRLLGQYNLVLSLLVFVDEWVYGHWKGHMQVLQYMRAYQQQACRELRNLVAAYVAWCMNLLHRKDANFHTLPYATQQICRDLSLASCALLSQVYQSPTYDMVTLNALQRHGAALDSDKSDSKTSASAEAYNNPFHRANGSDPYVVFDCESTTARGRARIAKSLSKHGKLHYHYIFEQSMSLGEDALFDAMNDRPRMISYDPKKMHFCTWVEACRLLPIVDLADYAFVKSEIGQALSLYECAAHNGCFLPRYDELPGFRDVVANTMGVTSSVEHFMRSRLSHVAAPIRSFISDSMYCVVIDEETRFIVDPDTQNRVDEEPQSRTTNATGSAPAAAPAALVTSAAALDEVEH